MLDIDFFKKYNDTYGHLAGDQIIKRLGKIIAKTVRIGDIAARYGGEEFVVLAYDADSENAYYLAERIRKQVQEKLQKDGITISIGVASYPKHGLDIETIIKKADEALYIAKRSGRNQVQICEK